MTHRANISKRERRVRPVKPEFAITGVGIGLLVGLLTGFAVEIFWKQNMIVMMLGGLAGVLLGAGFEAIRFWWRMQRFRTAKNSKP
jgi:hypothetical protein